MVIDVGLQTLQSLGRYMVLDTLGVDCGDGLRYAKRDQEAKHDIVAGFALICEPSPLWGEFDRLVRLCNNQPIPLQTLNGPHHGDMRHAKPT